MYPPAKLIVTEEKPFDAKSIEPKIIGRIFFIWFISL
jgi:hypothetical protein